MLVYQFGGTFKDAEGRIFTVPSGVVNMSTQPCGCDTTSQPRRYCEQHSFESPSSSNVQGATYDVDTGTMTVTFQSKGPKRIYQYPQFPVEIWRRFRDADSKGEFFQRTIRDIYAGVRVS